MTMTGNSILHWSILAESQPSTWRNKKMFVIKSIIAKLGDIAEKRAQNILMSNEEWIIYNK